MRLVVDTSVPVGELLRASGRARLGDDRLELFLREQMWAETPGRAAPAGRQVRSAATSRVDVAQELVALCTKAAEANIVILDEAIYAAVEEEALARCQRDPTDWPVVASAVALSGGHLDQRQRLPRHRRTDLDHPDAPDLA